jgi:ornithine cyclodeaminase/alanine dehydrogenase-like protein (mu-crystallin family)
LVFKSVGFAAVDLLAARTVAEAALASGIGRRVSLH